MKSLLSRVNTVYREGSSYDYSIDPPVEVLNASVELHSMMLYQTSGLRCSIVEMSVNSSVEELYSEILVTCYPQHKCTQ